MSRKVKKVSYKTVLNTCPSFLNGGKKRSGIEKQKVRGRVKNLAKDMGINILTCVRKLAPITSQARHFPPYSGEADNKEEKIHSFKLYYLLVLSKE